MNQLFPVFLKLAGRSTLVVGGGEVGCRKAESLLEAGAVVTVVSPELGDGLAALHGDGRINWVARCYRRGDLKGMFLAFAAVDDPAVSGLVHREAEEEGVLFNAVDHDPHCQFHVPATVVRGDLKIAISTAGRSPALAAELKERIARIVDDQLVESLRALGDLRPRVMSRYGDPRRRKAIFLGLVKSIRPGPEHRPRPLERSKVYLVGAGPGDAGLLTLRGAEILAGADEVYYDRLVGPGVLEHIPRGTARVFVGKKIGVVDRPDTGALLVAAARAGKSVVRLKGGDPYLFGRGGEEMLCLLRAGIPFEVVPGVSALNAVPASAGIPLTLRGMASEVVVRSGYSGEIPGSAPSPSGGRIGTTHVYLMTIGRLAEIVTELREEGLDPDTPVAVVQCGTLPDQKVLLATLGSLVGRVAREALKPPAMVIVGDVVRFANWKEHLPFLEAHGAPGVVNTDLRHDEGKP